MEHTYIIIGTPRISVRQTIAKITFQKKEKEGTENGMTNFITNSRFSVSYDVNRIVPTYAIYIENYEIIKHSRKIDAIFRIKRNNKKISYEYEK